MKIAQFFIIFVILSLVSTGLADDPIKNAKTVPHNIPRINGVEAPAQLLLPRTYIPRIPHSSDYFEYYSPDNYCHLDNIKERKLADIEACFKAKERWLTL